MKELFAGILNISISAGILIIVCVLVRLVFRKMPKYIRCLMWLLVAIRLAIPFSIESPLSLLPAREYVTVSSDNNADMVTKETFFSTAIGIEEAGDAYDSTVTDEADVVNSAESFSSEDAEDSVTFMSFLRSIDVMYVLSIVWIIGVAAVLIYAIVSYIRLRRLVDDAVILKDNVYQSERVGTAFVLGVISPKIYVPYGLSLTELYMSICHERAHISRRDHLVKPLGFIIAAVYWFNPLVWLAYILLCRDIELACDEKVIKKIGYDKKKDYSQALLNLSIPKKYISACPVAFGEVGINERIKNVLTMKKGKKIIIAVAVAICAVLAICFLTYPKKPKNNSGEVAEAETADETTESIIEEAAANDEENVEEVKAASAIEETSVNEETSASEESSASEDENSSAAESAQFEIETDGTNKIVYIMEEDGDTVKIGDKLYINGVEVNLTNASSSTDFVDIMAPEEADGEDTDTEKKVEIFITDVSNNVVSDASTTKDAESNDAIVYSYKDPSSNTNCVIVKLELQDNIDLQNGTNSEDLHICFPVIGKGVITRGFSDDHQGVDIAAEEGTAVVSLYDGTVEEVGSNEEEGNYIIIKNDKGSTLKYSHLKDAPNVSEGNRVNLGKEVGKVGSTGKSTGPHVHIEVTDENGNLIDPMSIIEE